MENTFLLDHVRKLARINNPLIKEFLAEFLGMFILMMFGDGSVAQSVLTGQANGDVFSINWGWAVAVMLAVLVSGGVSGGHVNPAVSLAMAVWGKFPWAKVPVYMVAQYLGSFCASAMLYGVYLNALDNYDPSRTNLTAGIWATYPGVALLNGTAESTQFLSAGNGLSDQIVGTMLLLICVCAITDPRNMEVPKALVPLFVGFTVLNIGVCFGFNCGYAINPARDLGPRIFTLIAGWGDHPFTSMTVDSVAWWWIPIIGPHIGAILGVFIYLIFIELHHTEAQEFNLPQVQRQDSIATVTTEAGGPYVLTKKISQLGLLKD